MKGGKAGRKRKASAGGSGRKTGARGKTARGAAGRPATAAPKKGSRKKTFGAMPSSAEE